MRDDAVKPKDYRRIFFKRWCVLWPITAALFLYPINNLTLRVATLLSLAALCVGLFFFFWRNSLLRLTFAVLIGVPGLLILLPGRKYDASELRRSYVTSLNTYEGTRYIWGGENRLGVDCSGLVRSALIVANYKQGIYSLNPELVREGLSLWWHDCSAKALGEEYRQKTRLLFSAESINKIDYSIILPGDIAVTSSGVHVLAYIGNQNWIEADPTEKRVINVHIPTENPWFDEPVNVMRWTQMNEGKSGTDAN